MMKQVSDEWLNVSEKLPQSILGICEKHNLRNFSDEMYVGDYGTDAWECIDWEPWRFDDGRNKH